MSSQKSKQTKPVKQVPEKKPVNKTSVPISVPSITSVLREHCAKINKMRALIKAKSTENKVIGDYCVIRPGDAKDVKSESLNELNLLQEQLTAMRGVARASIGQKIVKVKLFYEINSTGTIATAYQVSHPIAADNSAEFISYSGLYDEYRVTGGKVRFQECNNQGTPNTASVWMAMGYDSTWNTTPTSVVEVLESAQSRLYGVAPQIVNNYWAPYTAEAKGFFEFHFKIPHSSVLAATAVTGGDGVESNFPGQWIAASSLAGTSVGYLRTFVQSPGASNTIFFRAIVELETEWRERT